MSLFAIARRFVTPLLALILIVAPAGHASAAVNIQEVVSDTGVKAWLVEDYTVPIVSVRFAFGGGGVQDPVGKEGLANLMAGLFDEGAGDLDRVAFQEKLDEVGAEIRFNAGFDTIGGSMRMLAEDSHAAFGMLQLAVNAPRFDQAPLDRIRAQIIAGIEARARDPESEAGMVWARAVYGDHPYSRRDEGTAETLAAITREDLVAFHKRVFARDNVTIGVVGAIDAETLKAELDRVFGLLPESAALQPVTRVEPKLDQVLEVAYDLPQSSIRLAYPGLRRADPQFFAAYLMNHILGGGTFSSRLFDEVREKRGLAYSISSSLVNRDYASALLIGTSTRADRAAETLGIIREEVRRMAEDGPTAEELAAAKTYVKGAYAVNNLDSSGAIARTLVELQLDDLGIDYIERRTALIDAVTLDEVKDVATRLLSAEPAVMVLGPAPRN